VFEDGTSWSYARTLREVRGMAAALQELGVQQGEHVLLWLPNGPDFLRGWLAINYLGAVCVCVNTAYRGAVQEHVLRNSGGRPAGHAAGAGSSGSKAWTAAQLQQVRAGRCRCPGLAGLRGHGASALRSDAQRWPRLRVPSNPGTRS
jgi:crotonobetaine/carnitine-CoA ligase